MSSLPARAGRLGGWVRRPSGTPRGVVACLAGGTCTTAYFDLRVPGVAGYSMAECLADRGFVVMAFDHLGLGASEEVDDLYAVTPTVAASAQAEAIGEQVGRFPDLPVLGVGHSMGGHVAHRAAARPLGVRRGGGARPRR